QEAVHVKPSLASSNIAILPSVSPMYVLSPDGESHDSHSSRRFLTLQPRISPPLSQITTGECSVGCPMTVYLQHSTPTPEMWSGLPRYIPASAHDWGQMLTFEGKICSLSRAFTTSFHFRKMVNRLKVRSDQT